MANECGCGAASANVARTIVNLWKDYEARGKLPSDFMMKTLKGAVTTVIDTGCPGASTSEIESWFDRIAQKNSISEEDVNNGLNIVFETLMGCAERET